MAGDTAEEHPRLHRGLTAVSSPLTAPDENLGMSGGEQFVRIVMLLILACMVAGVLSTLIVPGSDEQVPPGSPLERPFAPARDAF